jgi:ion channel-forming bestrophin family protein
MIDYNPKEWLRFIFFFPRADTVRKLLPLLISIALYATLLAYLIIEHWKIGQNSDLKNISLMHSLLGFVISLLLVFRTNTAYDRWWEGRKQWGMLVNNSRNLALKLDALLETTDQENRAFFRSTISNFAFSLKNHLRKRYLPDEFEASAGFSINHIQSQEHVPLQFSTAISKRAIQLQKQGVLLPEHLLMIENELDSFMNICGACERIKNTPIPFSYSSFLKKFIFLYCITLPLGYVFSLHYLVVPFVVFVFYILGSLEVIAEEIEDPFGVDANDLPTDTICRTIRTSVHQIFKEST